MSRVTVWYDGGCPLCIREIALVRKLDGNDAIQFLDLTSPSTSCPLNRTLMLKRFHAREDDILLSGAAAFAAMWRAVPLLRPLGFVAKLPGVLTMLDYAYQIFLRFRPRLQRIFGGRITT